MGFIQILLCSLVRAPCADGISSQFFGKRQIILALFTESLAHSRALDIERLTVHEELVTRSRLPYLDQVTFFEKTATGEKKKEHGYHHSNGTARNFHTDILSQRVVC